MPHLAGRARRRRAAATRRAARPAAARSAPAAGRSRAPHCIHPTATLPSPHGSTRSTGLSVGSSRPPTAGRARRHRRRARAGARAGRGARADRRRARRSSCRSARRRARSSDGLREEVRPISRRLAEVKGLMNQLIRRLERLEGDLLAERHARVDDLALLVDLITVRRWRTSARPIERLERATSYRTALGSRSAAPSCCRMRDAGRQQAGSRTSRDRAEGSRAADRTAAQPSDGSAARSSNREPRAELRARSSIRPAERERRARARSRGRARCRRRPATNGRKSRSRSSAGIPGPVSSTDDATPSPFVCAELERDPAAVRRRSGTRSRAGCRRSAARGRRRRRSPGARRAVAR